MEWKEQDLGIALIGWNGLYKIKNDIISLKENKNIVDVRVKDISKLLSL